MRCAFQFYDPDKRGFLSFWQGSTAMKGAGLGRSTGMVPETIGGMAAHAPAFLDGLGLEVCDVLGFSLGGMVAQQMALDRPSVFRRMILVGDPKRRDINRDALTFKPCCPP